jgi:hypothetical protein
MLWKSAGLVHPAAGTTQRCIPCFGRFRFRATASGNANRNAGGILHEGFVGGKRKLDEGMRGDSQSLNRISSEARDAANGGSGRANSKIGD